MTDQRGLPLPTDSAPDIGAFQTQSVYATGVDPLDVNTVADDPVNSGQLSLRDAVNLADVLGGDQTITFDPSLPSTSPTSSATINLTDGTIALDDTTGTLTLDGSDSSNPVTVNANIGTGVFSVQSGSAAEIDGLTLGGTISDSGVLTTNGDSGVADNPAAV
jgi:hypothetical protein